MSEFTGLSSDGITAYDDGEEAKAKDCGLAGDR
jgi:hypothetical protein